MVSGKYSALSGAVAREQAMANIANNLANVNSSGFKKDRISFESLLRGSRQVEEAKGINYSRIRKIGTDFSQGAMQMTGKPLDVAISGEGFFKVRNKNEIYYTRLGNFSVDNNGMLKTESGFSVLGSGNQPLQLDDAAGKKLTIDETGNISVNGMLAEAKLQIFKVTDVSKLKKTGDTLFTLEQGASDQPTEDARIIQGSLEASNVNMMEEMVMMIDTQRKFEAYHKVLKSYSTLGEKQSELGTVG
ncbi:MAG: flagellar basal-body rod protein FlgF [Desulfobulbaceae bacterium]|nr:flagellar basal-body rod protein FlgF [Desulfobulbaceae bacterium]